MSKYALVVGISEYEDPLICDPPFASRDAEKLGECLEEDCGFDDVRVLSTGSGHTISSGEISKELIALRALMKKEDIFLFFFAGHGLYRDGQSVLLPADAQWEMPAISDIQVSALVGEMNQLKCAQRALVFDCCRNAPEVSRGQDNNQLSEDFTRDIKAVAREGSEGITSTCLLFSCSPGERAHEWADKQHGAYTYYLLDGLREKAWSEDRLTIQEVASYLEQEVPEWASRNGHSQLPLNNMLGSLQPFILAEREARGGASASAQGMERKPSAEEAEFERKWEELQSEEDELAELELEYATLHAQLAEFRLEYLCVVGVKFAELDEVLAEIAALKASREPEGTDEWEEAEAEAEEARQKAERSRQEAEESLEEEKKREKFKPTEEMKKLYRKASMKYHPDKARNDEDRERCTRIQAKLNEAYANGDMDRIIDILSGEHDLEDEDPTVSFKEKLIRLRKALAQIKETILGVLGRIDVLKQGELWLLRERVLESRDEGEDLLEKLATEAQEEIDAAREELQWLQEEDE